MKCTKRSLAVIGIIFAMPLSLSIGRLNARDADLASGTLVASSLQLFVKGALPGDHQIQTG